MASLYRKWRPQNFSEVMGQEHVKKTLLNALKNNKITHAYLFCGPRGTGKTTIARLLAKSLNCAKRSSKDWQGEPCSECASCKDITEGKGLDVIEIDAASNRGIDEIRELREKIKFAPGSSAHKVFIIDEVHMLTKEAFNALLKTLEEPPAHAVFILATTEAYKVPATILSRCQRYDFRKARKSELNDRLAQVAEGEGLKVAPEAMEIIGRLANGSYRDALSLLDQVSSAGVHKETIKSVDVQEILGIIGHEAVWEFYKNLSEGSRGELLALPHRLVNEGGDIAYFIGRLIETARHMMLIKSGVERQVAAPEWSDEEWSEWAKLAESFSTEEIMSLLRVLLETSKDIKNAPLPQMPLEIAVVKWCGEHRQEEKKAAATVTKEAPAVSMQDLKKVEEMDEAISAKVDAVSATEENEILVRFRVDGVLRKIVDLPKPLHAAIVSRIKILSNLKIDEQRLPQDGRFQIHLNQGEIDFRISTIPTVNGEKVVARILDKSAGIISLEQLGMRGRAFDAIQENISKSHGMILVTGPTGSGKTTTLYAALDRLRDITVNIITLEDPVEYRLPGVNQCQVKSGIGFSFASGLRSILRQDPNVIMVGEIRDKETAEIAVHSALTGHVVLSTLHTNDAAGAIPRLIDMGIEPFLLISSVNAVVAQRLCRKICADCREEIKLTEEELSSVLAELKHIPTDYQSKLDLGKLTFSKGKGCPACGGSGYKGRIGIFEVLPVNEEIKEVINQKSASSTLQAAALKQGMITMKQDGILKVLDGLTTIEEVWRVTKD